MGALTILDRLDLQAKERGDRPAVSDPRQGRFDAWDTLTWKEYAERTYELARAFIALGHRPGDSVAIIGPNSTAWVLADLAAIAAGGMPAGIYVTLTSEQAQYVARHSKASIVVASDAKAADKILSGKDTLPALKAVILFPGQSGADGKLLLSWQQALERASSVDKARLDEIRAAMKESDPATLIYTSGTTGPAKAVSLSHKNLTWTADAACALVDPQPGDRVVSYLPLSHIAEQMLTIHAPITAGVTVHFVPVMEQLADALRAVRPNALFGVPRVWEKIQAKVEAGVASAPPMRVKLFRAAQRVGLAVHRAKFEGRSPPVLESLVYPLFDRLVYSKLKDRLGLDQSRMAITGAAPMSPATRDWFLSLGLPISEVYGQSEGCGPTTFNKAGEGKLNTAGRALPGVQVRIAEDGEILVKGPNVFLGYLFDAAATADTVDAEGWLHSGDVGVLDPQGFLKITDRKKDLIITAGGKNVAPQNIEKELRELSLVSQAVVIGDQRKYLTALLTLKPEALAHFCQQNGVTDVDPAARSQHPKVREAIQAAIEQQVNPKLARYETIKRFEILPDELSEDRGEMTPTLKIKRKVVGQRYAAQIERMYEGEGQLSAAG
ncbi:MAG: AMP-binding protein [Deltaproteobacteria bacterium]|nr:AMP-binding protein [Deltaproteobacteria bacterium]